MNHAALANAIPLVAQTAPDEFAHLSYAHVLAVERDLSAACRALAALLSHTFCQLARLSERAVVTVRVRFRFQSSSLLMHALSDSYATALSESELGARIAAVARAPFDEAALRKLTLRLAATVEPTSNVLAVDGQLYEAALAVLKRRRRL